MRHHGEEDSAKSVERRVARDRSRSDEAWLVEDGPGSPFVRDLWNERPPRGGYRTLTDGPHRDWGHTPRQAALAWCRGDIAVHVDDDDVLAEGALAALRRWAETHPGAVLIPRMVDATGVRNLGTPVVETGQVGTGNFVHPLKDSLGAARSAPRGPAIGNSCGVPWPSIRRLAWCSFPKRRSCCDPANAPSIPCSGTARARPARWAMGPAGAWQTGSVSKCGARRYSTSGGLGRSRTRLERVATLWRFRTSVRDCRWITRPVEALPTGLAEHVTAFDVLEHVVDDTRWLAELDRLATRSVFLSTPNVWVSRCGNPYHVREYSPPLLVNASAKYGRTPRCEGFVLEGMGSSARVRETGADEWLLTEAPNLGVWVDVSRGSETGGERGAG